MVNALDMSTKLTSSTAGKLAENGINHIGRYLGHDWKGLEAAEAEAIKTAGMNIISIYENSNPSPIIASYFTASQGKYDAETAYSWAVALGQPKGTTIYFTCDFDAQMGDLPAIGDYFKAVMENMKDYAVGSYGSHRVINYLQTQRLASHFYQTIAWSNGQRVSGLHIYQYQCDVTFQGIQVDYINLEQIEVGSWGKDTLDTSIYVIKSGDTLAAIAAAYKTTVADLEKLNGITDPTKLQIGQVIKLPPAAVSQPATPTVVPSQHTNLIGKVIIWEHTVVRKGPGASFDIVETVEKGDVYNVYAENQGWLNVGAGWVSNKEGFFEALPLKLMGTCTVTAQTAPVRKGPDASFVVIETVNKDGVFNVYDDIKGWYNIGAGWISDNDVTFTKMK